MEARLARASERLDQMRVEKRYDGDVWFDAIHLKKLTYNESIPYETRDKVFPEYKEARRKRIEIRKNIERNQQA